MSTVDNRIVNMQFKNDQFQKNVQDTVTSLEGLKKGLNLDAASQSLQKLNVAGSNFTLRGSLAGIGAGVDQLASRFSTLGIVGITVIQSLTNSAIAAGKKITGLLVGPMVDGGIKRAESIAQAKFMFEGLGMDIEKTMKSALAAVNGTAYGLGDAAMVAAQFGASGIRAGDEMLSSLRAVAGVAAMTGREYSNIGSIFTSVAGNGRLMGNDLLQFSNAGLNVAAELAKSMGISEAAVRELVTSGDIGFKTFSKAMDKAFGKHATDANKLYSGALANYKAALSRIGAEIAGPSLENLRDIFNALRPVVDNVHIALMPLINDFNAIAKSLSTGVIKSLTGVNLSPLVITLGAVKNVVKGLYSILVPIKQAFSEMFPAATATQLLFFTLALRDLTLKFKMGDIQASNLKDTAKGVFAVLNIGALIVLALGKALSFLVMPILQIVDGLLYMTAAMGRYLVAVDASVRSSTIFNEAFTYLSSIITPLSNSITEALVLLGEAFNAVWAADTSGMDGFTNKVNARFEGLNKVINFLHENLVWLAQEFQKMFPVFGKLAMIVGGALKQFGDIILKTLNDGNFKAIFDMINGTLFAGILVGLNKYIYSITNIATKGGFLQNIVGVLNGVRASLRLWQAEIQAKVLKSIAISIGILAIALVALSMIDSEKLTMSLTAIGALLAELFVSMALFGKVAGGPGIIATMKIVLAMQGLGVAILILAFAMEKLSKLDWEGIAKGLTSVAGLCLILVAMSAGLAKAKAKLIQGSIGIILFAVAIDMLADSVIKMGAIDMHSLIKGLGSVGILVMELGIFMKLTSKAGMSVSSSLGLIALAEAILILSQAVAAFGALSVKQLEKGLAAVGVVLGELAVFVKLTGNAKNVISTALGLMILGQAMLILAQAVGALGAMPVKVLEKGLLAMAIALGSIALAVLLMPKGMIFTGAGIAIIAGALLILANVISVMGAMPVKQLEKGLLAMASALGIIAIAMFLMTTSLAGAVALVIVAGALTVLATVLQTLGAMSLEQIGKSLLALAGVFAVLGLGALILTPLVPVLLALGVAVLLLGVGCLAVGAGLTIFSIALTALGVALAASSGAIVLFVTAILGLIPMLLAQLGVGLVAFATMLATAAPAFVSAIVTIVTAIINGLVAIIPALLTGLLTILKAILGFLVTAIPMIVDAGMKLVMGLLKGIMDNIGQILSAGINIIIQFLKGVASKLPAIIEAAFQVIISFINGLAEAIRKNGAAIASAVGNLIDAIIGAIGGVAYKFVDAGANAVKGFVQGLASLPGKLWDAGANLGNSALAAAKKALEQHSPSKKFAEVGMYAAMGLANGLQKYAGLVGTEATNVGKTAISALTGAVSGISDIINGDMDANPTIRPVLDLSDVNQGLSSTFGQNQAINVDEIRSKTATISNMDANRRSGSDPNVDPTTVSGFKDTVLKTVQDVVGSVLKNNNQPPSIINFNGNYAFNDQNDINYFMNKSAQLILRRL